MSEMTVTACVLFSLGIFWRLEWTGLQQRGARSHLEYIPPTGS